jgi:tetratricopeptide (TPR) repeat protein
MATPSREIVSGALPAHDALAKAVCEAFFVDYDYHKTLALAHGRREPGFGLFRARAYGRLREIPRAAAACDEVLSYSKDRRERAEVAMFRAAFVDPDERAARIAIDAALKVAEDTGDPLLEVECRGHDLRILSATEGRLPDEAPLRRALARSEAPGGRRRPWYARTRASVRGNALHYLGLAYAAAGDRERDEAVHLEALQASRESPLPEHMLVAICLANLSFFVRHYPNPELRARIQREFGALPAQLLGEGPADVTRRALLVHDAAFGPAGASLVGDSRSAGTMRERTLTAVDALLFRRARNLGDFRAMVADVCRLAELTDWYPNDPGDDEISLLIAAVAPHDLAAVRKRAYVPASRTMFARVLENAMSRHRKPSHEFSRGILAKAHERLDEASGLLALALEHYRRYEIVPLAAIAGLERFPISRDPADLAEARAMLASFPDSSMSQRLRRALERVEACDPRDFPYLRYG